jgi:hypothetical protein
VADSIDVQWTNEAAFGAAMADIRQELAEPRRELDAGGKQLVAEAAVNSPRLTGRMAGAHRALPAAGKRVSLIIDTPYAAPIHWGWPGHGIGRRPWVVATWLRSSGPVDAMAGALQDSVDRAAART